MPIPTLQNVMDATRAHLGDDQVVGGEVFTNTLLQPYFAMAYREMFRGMDLVQMPTVRKVVYYPLPANTTVLVPATANINDIAAPIMLEERSIANSYAITGAVINSAVPSVTFTVASTTPLVSGNFITINGNMGITGTDGFWGIANVTAITFDCLGMVSTGVFAGSGTAVLSNDRWTEVVAAPSVDNQFINQASRGTLGEFVWFEEQFNFPPCNAQRQLRITYDSDGTAPTVAGNSCAVEDSLNFLSARTAGLAAAARGNLIEAERLNVMALGPNMSQGKLEGFLGDLVIPMVRALQNRPPQLRRKPPFRQPRSTTPSIW